MAGQRVGGRMVSRYSWEKPWKHQQVGNLGIRSRLCVVRRNSGSSAAALYLYEGRRYGSQWAERTIQRHWWHHAKPYSTGHPMRYITRSRLLHQLQRTEFRRGDSNGPADFSISQPEVVHFHLRFVWYISPRRFQIFFPSLHCEIKKFGHHFRQHPQEESKLINNQIKFKGKRASTAVSLLLLILCLYSSPAGVGGGWFAEIPELKTIVM